MHPAWAFAPSVPLQSSSTSRIPTKLAYRVFRTALYGYSPHYRGRGFKPDKDRRNIEPWKKHLHPDLWPEHAAERSKTLKPFPSFEEFTQLLEADSHPHARPAKSHKNTKSSLKKTQKREYSTSARSQWLFGLDTVNKNRLRLVALPAESLKPGDWVEARK